MEWYHYVIIAAGAVILVMLLASLIGDRKEPKKPEPKKAEPKHVRKTVKSEPKPALKAEKPEPVKKKVASVRDTPKVVESTDDKAQKYHVSQNKDAKNPNFKKWRVRKEGSNKTIKYFDTQKEAIDYAGVLASSAGSSVVIHKLDGSIRKRDYSKND